MQEETNLQSVESDQDLLDRYMRVRADHARVSKRMNAMKFGSGRLRKAAWAGSLLFLLLGMETEMEARGMQRPCG